MKKITKLSAPILFLLNFMIIAQINGQGLSSEEIKAQLVNDWQRAKDYTDEYLNTMPANKYSAKAVDSIRSFAQQALHLASANVLLMANATGEKPAPWASFVLEARTSAQSHDSVVYFVNASYDYCINAVKNSNVNKWGEKIKVFGFEGTRFAFIQKTFEHQTHHRGQLTIYIRLQDIRPPQERLF